MNVLHVESSLHWGGQEFRTVREARWLRANGHGAWIACRPQSELARRAADLALPVAMRRTFDPAAAVALGRLCRRLAIDVVHAHSPKDAWICSALHAAGIPVVRSRQITNPVPPRWSRSFIYRRGCARVVATADCIRGDLIRRNRVPPERIVVIGEGVDLSEFHPGRDGAGLRQELGVPSGAVLFGVVAMIRPEKGHLTFLAAAHGLAPGTPEARFAIVGEGTGDRSWENRVRAEAGRLWPQGGPVSFTGYRSDTPQVMAALDVLVVPSDAEAQSLVVPQAFATGRAVIASRVGGLPELIRDGENGLLVEPGQPLELARAMERLRGDAALRQRLAAAGRAEAATRLSFSHRMQESLSLYEAVSRPRRRPAGRRARFGAVRRRAGILAGIAALMLIAWLVPPESVTMAEAASRISRFLPTGLDASLLPNPFPDASKRLAAYDDDDDGDVLDLQVLADDDDVLT